MSMLARYLERRWKVKLNTVFSSVSDQILPKSSTESFQDFDRCVMLITEEHFKLKVSRCMTPHVCFSRVVR